MEHISKLKKLLEHAVRDCCVEREIGVIFSAGLDSTLIATIASKFAEVKAYNVGVKESHDITHSKKIKNARYPINRIELTEKQIESALPKIIKIINELNPLKTAVAVPFYFASKKAHEDGLRVMLCGQGGDELFGGYNKYLEHLKGHGYPGLEEIMRKDVNEIFKNQLNYDKKICKANGIELKFPFMDKKFIEYAMKIPLKLKIKRINKEKPKFSCVDEVNNKKYIRKYILRKVAQEFSLPAEVINRRKKAAQYGSGVQKVMEKLAKKNGFRYVREYVENLHATS